MKDEKNNPKPKRNKANTGLLARSLKKKKKKRKERLKKKNLGLSKSANLVCFLASGETKKDWVWVY